MTFAFPPLQLFFLFFLLPSKQKEAANKDAYAHKMLLSALSQKSILVFKMNWRRIDILPYTDLKGALWHFLVTKVMFTVTYSPECIVCILEV